MNLDEFYKSIASFWDTISPILFAHIIALLAIRWIAGFRWNISGRMESFLSKDRYKRWKNILDEFELRPKIPYLLVISIVIYFVLFNSLLLDSLIDFPPIRITYSETQFWEENRPLEELAEIGSYGKNPNLHVWEIHFFKDNFLQDYRTKFPDHYRSLVSWLSELYGKWLTYYKCSIIFLAFVLVLTFFYMRKKQNRSFISFRRILALLIFSVLGIAFTRYEAEKYIEKQLRAEMSFVTTQLHVDSQAQQNRLDEQGINQLKRQLYLDLKQTDQRPPDLFWWARILERYSIGKRAFPHLSDAQFFSRYGYLEQLPTPSQ